MQLLVGWPLVLLDLLGVLRIGGDILDCLHLGDLDGLGHGLDASFLLDESLWHIDGCISLGVLSL